MQRSQASAPLYMFRIWGRELVTSAEVGVGGGGSECRACTQATRPPIYPAPQEALGRIGDPATLSFSHLPPADIMTDVLPRKNEEYGTKEYW